MKVSGDVGKITVGQSDLSRALNISRQRVTQLIQEKIFLRDESDPSGGVFLFESLRNYWLRQVEKDGDDYFKVKAAHEKVKKDLSELKLREREGEVVEAGIVLEAWADILTTLRTNLLALPAKFSAQFEGKNAAEIYKIMTVEIEDKLQEISAVNVEDFK